MINKLLMKLNRPEKGYDPISKEYANYFSNVRKQLDCKKLIDELEKFAGNIKEKDVIDIGAGPGFITKELALRGANVFWYDISENYMKIAKRNIPDELNVDFKLGYMEAVSGLYDIIIIYVCWNYCIDDALFLKKILSVLKKGGTLFIVFNNETFFRVCN